MVSFIRLGQVKWKTSGLMGIVFGVVGVYSGKKRKRIVDEKLFAMLP